MKVYIHPDTDFTWTYHQILRELRLLSIFGVSTKNLPEIFNDLLEIEVPDYEDKN